MKQRPLNMYVRPSKEVGSRPVIKTVEVNKRTFFTYGKKNKVDFLNKKKVNEKIKNFFYTFNILIGYPILILTLAGLLFYCPEVLLVITIIGKKIFDYYSNNETLSLILDNAPLIEYITLDQYSAQEYLIYKDLFTDNISGQEAFDKRNDLQMRLQLSDQNIINDRSPEVVLKSYIDDFIMETSKPKSDYAILRMFGNILDFLAQKEYFLKIKFTAEGEIPTLNLHQYYRLADNGFEDLAELRSRLSISELNVLNQSSREEVPFIALDVPTANHDVPVDPHMAGKRNTPSVKPPIANCGPAVPMETVNLVSASMVKLNAKLQESDQIFIDGQNKICAEFNKNRELLQKRKEEVLSQYQYSTKQAEEIEKVFDETYEDLAKKYIAINTQGTTYLKEDYNDFKDEVKKLYAIDISEHPVIRREPVSSTLHISQNMNEAAKVK